MHKHPITYKNFNGETKSKELYFNLTEAELTKFQKDYLDRGGIQVVMNNAIDSGDTRQVLDFIEILVRRSYGIKSPDGELFDKNEKIWSDFENSAFYSDLYMSLFQDGGAVGQAFIRAILPADLIAKAEANVRGEGELAQAVQSATQFKPDARSVFEQSRENLKDHMSKVDERNSGYEPAATNVFSQPQVPIQNHEPSAPQVQRETYVPQNQPQGPSFGGTPQAPNEQTFRVEAQDPNFIQQNEAERVAEQTHMSRPPHESGPGYSVGTNGE